MYKAGDLLKEFLVVYNLTGGEKYVSLFSSPSWRKIAGDDIAGHSRIVDLRNGTLVVELDHPGWMQMLNIKHDEILGKLKAKYPTLGIRTVLGRLVNPGQFSPPSGSEGEERKASAEEAPPQEAKEDTQHEAGDTPRKSNSQELKDILMRLKNTLKERERKK